MFISVTGPCTGKVPQMINRWIITLGDPASDLPMFLHTPPANPLKTAICCQPLLLFRDTISSSAKVISDSVDDAFLVGQLSFPEAAV